MTSAKCFYHWIIFVSGPAGKHAHNMTMILKKHVVLKINDFLDRISEKIR